MRGTAVPADAPEREYDCKADARTLMEAEEIRADEKRMQGVREHAGRLKSAVGRGKRAKREKVRE
jgi:hypothetical protein